MSQRISRWVLELRRAGIRMQSCNTGGAPCSSFTYIPSEELHWFPTTANGNCMHGLHPTAAFLIFEPPVCINQKKKKKIDYCNLGTVSVLSFRIPTSLYLTVTAHIQRQYRNGFPILNPKASYELQVWHQHTLQWFCSHHNFTHQLNVLDYF